MGLSKKHYIKIAEILNRTSKAAIIKELADYFKSDNLNFDAAKFLDASGYWE